MTEKNYFKWKYPSLTHKKQILAMYLIAPILISTIFFYTYIKFTPFDSSQIPRINIVCNEKIERDTYVNCSVELIGKEYQESINKVNAKIKLQGITNARLPKKSYRLELSKQVSLLGLRRDDDWTLFAMYLDYTRMRIKLAFDLWRSLESSNPTAVLPKSEYVNVYLNGKFQGLYLLAEKNDRKLFGLDKNAQNNINSSLIFQAKSYESFRGYFGWEQDWPNEDEGIFIMKDIMINLIDFINNSDDNIFFNPVSGIYSKFDKLNLIDFYLYNFFIYHRDFWSNNFYVIRDSNPNKFYLIPWDFDGSFGQKGYRKYSAFETPESEIIKSNELFTRLIKNENFSKDCSNRWRELREKFWTNEFILDMLIDIYNDICDMLDYEMELWEPKDHKEETGKKFIIDEYIECLFHWIPERLEFCDSYFTNFL